mgnify:CR=1 FL=1
MKQNRQIMQTTFCAASILLLALLAAGCSKKADAAGDAADQVRSVDYVTVTTAPIVERRIYTGDLEATASVALYPLLQERIVSFPVEEGTEVKAGQVIALIRAASLKESRAQTQAQIEALDETLASQSRELERARSLHESRIVTQQTLDQMESAYRTNLAQRKVLDAGLGQVEITAGNAIIKAPFDGIISGKRLEQGDIASPAQPLCTVVQMDPIRLSIPVIERDLAVVRTGLAVEVTVDAHPGRVFRGEVTRILPVLDPGTRTNEVRIEIPNPVEADAGGPALKPGMFGHAEIIVRTVPDAVVVPTRSLMVDPEGRTGMRRVLVLTKDNVAQEKLVETGTASGDVFEVKSGLAAGERVVVRGQYGVADGERVKATDISKDGVAAAPAKSAQVSP